MKTIVALILLGTASLSFGNPAHPSNNTPSTAKGFITVQEMLINGPPQLKMHSLAMISQGNIQGDVDESFLPGFKACAEDPSSPIRSIAARLIGENFVKSKDHPNAEAMELLIKLSKDESADVRYNAAYHGLSQLKNPTPETAELLIDIAAENRQETLHDRIIVSLANFQPQVTEILNRKLQEDNAIAYFEIYEDFTGKPPINADKYLDMPSSRTRMFIVSTTDNNSASAKTELIKELKEIGLQNPSVQISGTGANYALVVKTYITRDGLAVEKKFSGDHKFKITQQMWLTPELEIQLENMHKSGINK